MPEADPAQAPVNRTIKTVRVYRQVADSLETRIASGEFEPGHRLTTERDLAREYGVSRTCVREALLALEIAGLVTIKVGSGVFVLPPPAPDELTALPPAMPDQNSPSDILQARLALEPEISRLAATTATTEDLDVIDAFVQKMREEHRMATETEHGDREFHFAIARATQNPVLLELLQRIWEEMTGPMWQALQRHIRTPLMRLKWIEDHEAIVAALRSGSPETAQSAMRSHIRNVMETLDEARFR
ncbi:FadR/GntR family transcriptional regulator [Oceanicola sp. 502str15]|uniref:FadR/GntR family transcriptional regulator n=1 Tax=Oceanicola sp. 502str15 TaxID=2696061 RepID=UPI002095BDDB|nr:FadR/GntR family transcriptional regulator [Oceanicola sp. 502str15]MCO6383272.1 FCD domain-containing protein [Oceanicola sp. 502str15]